MNRRKLTGVVASIVVAALGTVILLKSVNSSKPAPVALNVKTVKVLQALRPIPPNTPADLLKENEDYKIADIPEGDQLADAISEVGGVTGLVTNAQINPKEQFSRTRFDTKDAIQKTTVGDATGLIKVWVDLDRIQAMNGHLAPGDTVAVYANFTGVAPMRPEPVNETQTASSTSLILHRVLVTDCTGCSIPVVTLATVKPADGSAPAAAVAEAAKVQVELAIDAPQSERLVFAAKFGSLWLGAEDQSVDETNTNVQDRSIVYNTTKPQGPSAQSIDGTTGVTTTTVKVAVKPGKPAAVAPATPAGNGATDTGIPPTVAPVVPPAANGVQPASVTPTVAGQ